MWSTGCKWDLISVGRRSLEAWNLYTFSAGHQCFNSRNQLPITDLGHTTKCGPLIPNVNFKYANSAIVWNVLPRPISSAKMPFTPRENKLSSQFTPSIWYYRSVPRIYEGVVVRTADSTISNSCPFTLELICDDVDRRYVARVFDEFVAWCLLRVEDARLTFNSVHSRTPV